MKYLLDTHVFIWYATGDARLSQTAKDIIETNFVRYISIASIWEMAIKVNRGKLQFNAPFDQAINQQLLLNGYELLPVKTAALFELSSLPLHHRDPFDRTLISQAIVENIPIISADHHFDLYNNLTRVW